MIISKKFILILFFLFLLLTQLIAEIKLPAVFSDHMVLQQQSAVPIWGWSDPGERITINCSWLKHAVNTKTTTEGSWNAILNTPKAGGPYQIIISGMAEKSVITDIMIGEVWLCSGQSNMVFRFSDVTNAEMELKKADFSNIRYMEAQRQVSETALDDAPGSEWMAVNTENAAQYSAVALFFAMKLQRELNVPVGILEAAWGGTAVDSWTPTNTLTNDSALSIAIQRWQVLKKVFKSDSIGYDHQLLAWKNKEIKKKPKMPTSVFIMNRPHRQPGTLYNGMIHPFTKFKIKGILWYQGETNRKWSTEYAYAFGRMIESWRDAWREELPFYFVQIAPFKGNAQGVSEIMEAQYEVFRNVDKTGMVVTMDVGNMNDIHPRDKRPVGERLAGWALSNTYAIDNINCSGPLFKTLKYEGGVTKLMFDHVEDGLMTVGKPKGFEIIAFNDNGTQKAPTPVDVSIDGSELIIRTQGITKPFIIRYGWAEKMAVANLFDQGGLPASPFRVLVK